jgi:hypothetical protein
MSTILPVILSMKLICRLVPSEPRPQPSLSLYLYHVPHSLTGLQEQYSLYCSPHSHWFTQSPSPSPPYTCTMFHTHSQGYRTNIIYTVPLPPIGSLRAPAPAPLSRYLYHVPHSLTGSQDKYSLHCSPYSHWLAHSPGPSPPSPYTRSNHGLFF